MIVALYPIGCGINFYGKREADFLRNTVNLCAYTGKILANSEKSLEHVYPRSKMAGGDIWDIGNLMVTGKKANTHRDDIPFKIFLMKNPEAIENIVKYLNKYKNLEINGIKYVQRLMRTLNREAVGVVRFETGGNGIIFARKNH